MTALSAVAVHTAALPAITGVVAMIVYERRRKAVAIYGLMVGPLQLARAVHDRKLSVCCIAAPMRLSPWQVSPANEQSPDLGDE